MRIVIPNRLRATTATTRDLLISRGDQTIAGVNFGLQLVRRSSTVTQPVAATAVSNPQVAAVDAVFAADEPVSTLVDRNDPGAVRGIRRARPR